MPTRKRARPGRPGGRQAVLAVKPCAPPQLPVAAAGAARRRELREEVVLECAATWFHKHGFHGTSLADIAGELGVTKPALYHYAASKQELLRRLHLRSLAATRGARDRAVAEGRNGIDRLYRLVYNFVLVMTGSPTNTFILLEPGTLDERHSKEILEERRWLEHDLRELVRDGIADKSIVPCDPKLVTFIIVGAQNWIGRWFRPDAGWSGEQIAAGYAAMMRRMLSVDRDVPVPCDIGALATAHPPVFAPKKQRRRRKRR